MAYGRLLVECAALCAQRVPAAGGALTSSEIQALRGDPEQPGATQADVRTAFEPVLARGWDALCAEVDEDTALGTIAATAELSDIEVAVLALCGAVELDPELHRLCGVANDDPARDFVTVGLVGRALGPDASRALGGDATLRCAALLDVETHGPLAAAQVRVARPVGWALAGTMSFDPDLPADTDIALAPEETGEGSRRVLVAGDDRVRRLQAAVQSADGLAFLVTGLPSDDIAWRAVVRQATVAGLGVVLELSTSSALDGLGRHWLARAAHLTWALCASDPVALESLPAGDWIDIPSGAAEVTDSEWAAVFDGASPPARRPHADQLRLARVLAQPGIDPQTAIRRVASGTLLRHARRIVPQVGWDELILPAAQEQRLRDLVDRYRQRGTVHDEWGLPLFPSPGVVALFSGPSGTGKTTTAEVIARELGVDMFRVDLSALVSKYIGETEKNLEQIFSAAHAGDYLLLFDEADSLFGSRSKVSDARDRYANMEVSYLLQRLESYDGFVVLTSNFQGNIDQAFLRRIHVTVHFPVPDAQDRERIWDRCLAEAPRKGVDLGFVAEKFELSGGSIRNAALTAAFLAAGRGTPIGMAQLLQAVSQEMTKLGQRPTAEQFGKWATHVVA